MADDLRHWHRGLLRRRLELRVSGRRVWDLHDSLPRPGPGAEARRPLFQPAAFWDVSLAHTGSDTVPERPSSHYPGARLALDQRGQIPLPAAPGRHRIDSVLVPNRAARGSSAAGYRQSSGGRIGEVNRVTLELTDLGERPALVRLVQAGDAVTALWRAGRLLNLAPLGFDELLAMPLAEARSFLESAA